MGSSVYGSVAELEAISNQLTEAERDLCSAEVAPQVKLYFPDDMQAKIDGLSLTTGLQQNLLAYAADTRWRTETQGVMVNNHPIKTDADSQRKVAVLQASLANGDIAEPIQFKLADGSFMAASAADIDGFNAGITNYLQACYDAELQARESILAGTTTTNAQVDAFFAGL